MNTLNKINRSAVVLITMAAMSIVACNDDFMDRTPVSDLNDANYWRSETDLKVYNNGIYNAVASQRFFIGNESSASASKESSFMAMEAVSDNFASTDANLQKWANIAAGLHSVDVGTTPYGRWNYELLYRINYFLDNYEKVTSIPEATRNRYAGEAYFWRAWFYFDKMQEFGDAPLIQHALNELSPELYAAQDPRTTIAAAILSDIDRAIAYLPEEWAASGIDRDRVNKYTALTLKTRICLYEGTWRKYHTEFNLPDANKFLTEAVNAAQEVISSGKYEIYNTGNPNSDYRDLFTSLDLHGNSEVILAKYYDAGKYTHSINGNLVTAGFMIGVTKDLVDDYLVKEDANSAKPIALSHVYRDDSIEAVFDNRDPRLAQTVLDPRRRVEMLGNGVESMKFPRLRYMAGAAYVTLTGYNYIKNFNLKNDANGGNAEITDFPILRYAEVLLSYAEAKAELGNGNISQSDLDKSINLLRARVDMPPLTENPDVDPKYQNEIGEGLSSVLIEIRRERRVELSFENSRYHDLMRWKKGAYLKRQVLGMRLEDADVAAGGRYDATNATNACVRVEVDGKKYIDVYAGTQFAANNRVFDEGKHYLFPLSTNVRAKNPNLKQTVGW